MKRSLMTAVTITLRALLYTTCLLGFLLHRSSDEDTTSVLASDDRMWVILRGKNANNIRSMFRTKATR